MHHINRCCLVAIFTPLHLPSKLQPSPLPPPSLPPETNTLSFPALGPLSNHDTLNSRTQHFLPLEHLFLSFFSSSPPLPLFFLHYCSEAFVLRAAREIAACVREGEDSREREEAFFPLPPLRACLCYMLGELRAGAHTAPHQRQQPSGAAADKKADFKGIKWSESEKETCWMKKKILPKKKEREKSTQAQAIRNAIQMLVIVRERRARSGVANRSTSVWAACRAVDSPSRIQFHCRMKSGCSHRLDPSLRPGRLDEGVIRDAEKQASLSPAPFHSAR